MGSVAPAESPTAVGALRRESDSGARSFRTVWVTHRPLPSGSASGVRVRPGRTIPPTREGFIINETAADLMGLEDPVEKHLFTEEWERMTNEEGEAEWEQVEVQTGQHP